MNTLCDYDMATTSYSRDDILDILDDWSDSDAGGMSSGEEDDLDRQFEQSSRQVFSVFSVCQCRHVEVAFTYDAFAFCETSALLIILIFVTKYIY